MAPTRNGKGGRTDPGTAGGPGPARTAPVDDPTRWPPPGAQSSDWLTTKDGVRLPDTDHSLRPGGRGPTLLEDFHFREKITHFDHERIPERVVHARGAGAHGVFTAYGNAAALTRAGFLAQEGKETPVFVRFSTVAGSRGSADTVRDVRGFAVKFYTDEGTVDLVGNNMPVFFIQDGIKFPDVIHAAKPHPDREIPQAQTAHDTFWDFVSLHTEATHMLMWAMSDRAIPRSYRTMEGFGVHTFRLVDADGGTSLVKFHWKPVAGVHSLVWEEAQLAAGFDPDFHRRDLADAIDNGAFPEWELGVQVMPDGEDETFEGIDLLDPTKIVPEELAPVQPIGRMTLDRNPSNYFAETEQVAFHTAHLVTGIEGTDDPLLQARNFSYLDTQLSRLGGPNFHQLPINRTHAPVDDLLRDGMHQTAVHSGIAPYLPNSLADDRPAVAGIAEGGYVNVPRPVAGPKVRDLRGPATVTAPSGPAARQVLSFDDHFSQAALFWRSMTPVEQDHIADAFTFELGKCFDQAVKERMLTRLAQVDAALVTRVADGLGLPAPDGTPPPEPGTSPALSQLTGQAFPPVGRVVGLVAGPGSDAAAIASLRTALLAEQVLLRVIAPHGGTIGSGKGAQVVERTPLTTRSIEFDAVLVAAGADGGTGLADPRTVVLLQEAFRHGKPIGSWGDGAALLEAAGVSADAPGVIAGTAAGDVAGPLLEGLAQHRFWARLASVAIG